MQEAQVCSMGREDPLEKGTATHSRILAWRIPWAEEPGRLQPIGSQRVRHDLATNTHAHTHAHTQTHKLTPEPMFFPRSFAASDTIIIFLSMSAFKKQRD